jgi:hypothetical protein
MCRMREASGIVPLLVSFCESFVARDRLQFSM